MKNPEISIITVNFAASKKLERLKKSLQNLATDVSWEWIVVDNFSSEEESQRLKNFGKDDERIHTITLNKNLGYGEGNAEGVRFANGEFLAIVNPDIEIEKNVFANLLQKLKQTKKPTICVPVLQTKTGQILENTRNFPQIMPLLIRRIFGGKKQKNSKKTESVDWAQGSFWLLEKKLFQQLNGFDTRFFLFFEDTDFCRRVKKMGGQIIKIPTAISYHDPNRLSGGNIFKALGRKTFWIHIHSAIKYFTKWGIK